jgi:signal transduction histidine kinase/CheY-like chemotaxis protein
MNLRRGFLTVATSLSGLLFIIAGITWAALNAFNHATEQEQHRQNSLTLMSDVRHEVDLLGRLVNSYVSTADPRFLHYYYDILGIREGSKFRPENLPPAFWDQIIAGSKPYLLPAGPQALSLVMQTHKLEFDAQEQAIVSRILTLTEQMKRIEQVAFAATQGLYDPEQDEFVSETKPQREFANQLLHRADYLKLRADLALTVEELSNLVDTRTQSSLTNATRLLENWIIASLGMLALTLLWLIFGYHYLRRNLLKPLTALHQTATALAGKAYNERVGKIRGVDEVKTLATTIDGMAAAIEADIGQREITQRELGEARARAEVATQAKSIFLANMSHEIRTPMNAILGMAYLALKSGLPARQHEQVNKIHGAAKTLLGILNDILDFSKIEAGKIELESTPFALEEVTRNALGMIQQRASEKQLELILHYPNPIDSCQFMGDSLRLGQILINLLSNAVKFTETGHVALRIEETVIDADNVQLSIAIEDTGIGMTPAQIEQLFQEFSQADGSTTRKYGGTGLGLSISKRLVEAMGGEIKVTSVVDRGSCFAFSVNLPRSAVTPNNACPTQFTSRRALVVDDYEPSRASMAGLLCQLGWTTVDTANCGNDAVARLQSAAEHGESYDLLLLDWLMPGLSGREVLDTLHARQIPLPARSIVISALDASLLRDEVAALGIPEVLQKPLLPDMLSHPQALNELQLPPALGYVENHEQPLAGMRILVVDDDSTNRLIADELLRDWGAEVVLETDGAAAVKTLFAHQPEHFNLVLMDLEMPIMNGHAATQHLRADPRFAELPVLAMTAYAVGPELELALNEGMNGHIPKPFDPDELLALLCAYQRKPKSQAAIEKPGAAGDMPAQLLAIPELDLAALNHRFQGRSAFLRRMLHQFSADFGNFTQAQQDFLLRGDTESALRQAHSLKGLAGTFGMARLQRAALAAEHVLRIDGTLPQTVEQVLSEELSVVLAAISQLDQPANADKVKHADAQEARLLLARLRHFLEEADGEAENLWANHKAQFSTLFSLSEIARIDRAISNWDFDQALAALLRSTPKIEKKS